MPRLPLRAACLLPVALAAVGCAGSGGIPGLEPTSTAATAAAATTTSRAIETTTLPSTTTSTTTTTTTTLPPTTTTTIPPWGVECPPDDAYCAENTAAAVAYLQENVTGGRYGFYFSRIPGGTLASLDPIEGFYPASAIKILHHIHAIRWVGTQPDAAAALATPIPVYRNFCAGSGDSWDEALSAVLQEMMLRSLDQYTDAIQDHFGQEEIGRTATEVIGLRDTLLAHRFGCGGASNDPANRSTAADLAWIYRQIGMGTILSPEERDLLASLMLGPPWPRLERVVREEGAALGLDEDTLSRFRDGIDLLYKAGWLHPYYTLGGYLSLPAPPCDGAERQYAFGVFQIEASRRAEDFNVTDLVSVALRGEIRAALEALATGC